MYGIGKNRHDADFYGLFKPNLRRERSLNSPEGEKETSEKRDTHFAAAI